MCESRAQIRTNKITTSEQSILQEYYKPIIFGHVRCVHDTIYGLITPFSPFRTRVYHGRYRPTPTKACLVRHSTCCTFSYSTRSPSLSSCNYCKIEDMLYFIRWRISSGSSMMFIYACLTLSYVLKDLIQSTKQRKE